MGKKVYWKGVDQLTNDPEFIKNASKEFPQELPIEDAFGDNTDAAKSNRRDFLKLMGFSVAAVSLAACDAPVKKAIPYLNKPEEIDPGIPNFYASTYVDGSDYCPIVVKTREGRPIFVQGNSFSSLTKGGTSPRVNASVMSLYDTEKVKYPTKNGEQIDWQTLDGEISAALASASNIRIVTNTVLSPSMKRVLRKFVAQYSSTKVITYDQDSSSAILEANQKMFGKAVIPSYKFGKAKTVVSFGADFLGSWISGVEYAAHFGETRKVGKDKKEMSQHFQFEAIMSLTGANADYRTPIRPSQEGLAVAKLYNLIAAKVGGTSISTSDIEIANLEKAADALVASSGSSLVVSGSNDVAVQLLINGINTMLKSYGNTIDLERPSYQKQGVDSSMNQLVDDLASGSVDAVIFYNCNPVYDYARGAEIATALPNVALTIATADRLDETASLCTYNCPDSHFLESWNDYEPVKGVFSLGQPTINPIFDTRQVPQSLLTWSGDSVEYADFIKEYWKETLFPMQSKESSFEAFWFRSLHDGVFEPSTVANFVSEHEKPMIATLSSDSESAEVSGESITAGVVASENSEPTVSSNSVDFNAVANEVASRYKADNTEMEFVAYFSNVMGWGTQANNPILQETPDPISKACWGNYIAVTQKTASDPTFNFKRVETKVSVAKLTVNGVECELPVVIQPGQAEGVVAVMMGYGRNPEKSGKVAKEAGGFNAIKLLSQPGTYQVTTGVALANTGKMDNLALIQTQETAMGRETIIQETTLPEYKKNPKASRFDPKITGYRGEETPGDISLWDIQNDGYGEKERRKGEEKKMLNPDSWNNRLGRKADIHAYPNHHWGMSIDLNSCNGCSACIVACNVENNVPVVGKKEVIMRREMHWLRIDRYYSSTKNATSYKELAQVVENPEVVFQPMMCQHCNNAPCETVCPVAATTHSSEGLNQMTYNRCVGTKYCANNCPYKVRRFNWFKYHTNKEFDYHMNNDLGRMVLNPDVTVRSRGVMEKCSLCVQRIQEGKLKARREGRPLRDGDASTACANACPTNAITFGDLNDTKSNVRTLLENELEERAYTVLEEINTSPNIWYLAKVRNKSEAEA